MEIRNCGHGHFGILEFILGMQKIFKKICWGLSRLLYALEIDFNQIGASFFEDGKMPEEKLSQTLKTFLEKGKDWERKATSVPGIFLLKLPPYRNSPSQLAVEINPIDTSGDPTKRRGLILRSPLELKEFRKLINEAKLEALMGAMEEVNPSARKPERLKHEKEVIEI